MRDGRHYVFQIWDGNVEEVLKLPCYTEKLDRVLCLFAKVSVDGEGLFRVNMRHFEIMF
jgi:hypothetical protein